MGLAVKYIGPKTKVGVLIPVGVKNKTATIGNVQFIRNKTAEMDEEDAIALCEMDKNFVISEGVKIETEAAAPKKATKKKVAKKKPATQDFDSFMESKLGA